MRVTITISVILLLTMSLFPQSEYVLKYDSGEPDKSWTFNLDGWFFTTRFTPIEPVKLAKARFYIADTINGATFNFSIYRAGENEPGGAFLFREPMRVQSIGWNEIDLLDYNFRTDEDFYLSIEYDYQAELSMGVDSSDPIDGRSFDSDC
jgi:hypothetical protein